MSSTDFSSTWTAAENVEFSTDLLLVFSDDNKSFDYDSTPNFFFFFLKKKYFS